MKWTTSKKIAQRESIEQSVMTADEVLQDELGRASDEGMKNIAATIQRDQNAIIRNDEGGC